MRVHIDPDRIQEEPGDVSTDDGIFVDAPFRPIPQLAHDSLSMLQFGEGAVRHLLLGVQPSEGAMAYAFVSLLERQDIEVRILRGAPPIESESTVPGAFGRDLFAVFPLTKQRGTCGF